MAKKKLQYQRCSLSKSLGLLCHALSLPMAALLVDTLVAALILFGTDLLCGTHLGAATLQFICNHVPLCVVCIALLFMDSFLVLSCMAIEATVPPITKENVL